MKAEKFPKQEILLGQNIAKDTFPFYLIALLKLFLKGPGAHNQLPLKQKFYNIEIGQIKFMHIQF